jgi:hypothetical protein
MNTQLVLQSLLLVVLGQLAADAVGALARQGCHVVRRQLTAAGLLLYNNGMGRPRGSKHTAMINGRITAEQMEWLEARAQELGGNLSAALRQTITDARLLEIARSDYGELLDTHPEFKIPDREDSGASRTVHIVLATTSSTLSDAEDVALREQEVQRRAD